MRVTAQTKAATRTRILQAAQRLFADKGYEQTTTRDIADGANIASGTLFNYFPSKEAIVACLANDAMDDALAQAEQNDHQAETLEEDLFAFVAAALRKLKRLRRHLPSLLESSFSPLNETCRDDSALLDDSINMFVGWLRRQMQTDFPAPHTEGT